MADNNTGLNAQYGATQFGLNTAAYASTGAPGTPGVSASETSGSVIASPVVSTPGASSQIPANAPRVQVMSGDTTGMSSDAVVPSGGDPLTGLSAGQLTTTGAGQGHVAGPHHPNAGGGA
jgi:hypothetical protein